MKEIKPRIYWVYYPRSQRGYWRVSLMPSKARRIVDLWCVAQKMARQMNEHVEQRNLVP